MTMSDNWKEPGKGKRPPCGARTKAGTPCKVQPMANGKCYVHGGPTPKGVASPHHKHGRYSKYMPSALRESAEAFLRDPEILSLQANVAMTDALLADALQRLEEGGGLAALTELRKLRERYQQAVQAKNQAAQDALLRLIMARIDEAGDVEDVLRGIERLTEQRRRLVDTEVKRQTSDQSSITLDRAFGFIDLLLDVVARHVKEHSVMAAIIEEVAAMRGPAVRALPPGQ